MFLKHLGELHNAEAEWVLEVLEMHDNDEAKALEGIRLAVERIIEQRQNKQPYSSLTAFEQAVDACCFASRNWWPIGLDLLKKMGKWPPKSDTEPTTVTA